MDMPMKKQKVAQKVAQSHSKVIYPFSVFWALAYLLCVDFIAKFLEGKDISFGTVPAVPVHYASIPPVMLPTAFPNEDSGGFAQVVPQRSTTASPAVRSKGGGPSPLNFQMSYYRCMSLTFDTNIYLPKLFTG